MYPKVKDMLENMCAMAQTEMAIMEPSELGGIDRAVTTSDGIWLTRRHFSQNHTCTIRNYIINVLCMRGSENNLVDDDLFEGTAISRLKDTLQIFAFELDKHEVNWQYRLIVS